MQYDTIFFYENDSTKRVLKYDDGDPDLKIFPEWKVADSEWDKMKKIIKSQKEEINRLNKKIKEYSNE